MIKLRKQQKVSWHWEHKIEKSNSQPFEVIWINESDKEMWMKIGLFFHQDPPDPELKNIVEKIFNKLKHILQREFQEAKIEEDIDHTIYIRDINYFTFSLRINYSHFRHLPNMYIAVNGLRKQELESAIK